AGGESTGTILAIEEEGVRFRSYVDGRERFLGPETSMGVQAALGSDIALVFDECTPFHVSRDYTARSTQRTHRWLDRCLDWHRRHGPQEQAVYGIVQGGVEQDLRLESAGVVAASDCDGIAIGGSLGQDKAQMYEVVSWTTAQLQRDAPNRPRHLLGIGDVDDLITCVQLGIDTFDCAMPTRLGLVRGRWPEADQPILDGCPCPACAAGFTRAYLHYLLRAGELTALRLVTLHNLSFIARLMTDLRTAIDQGSLAEVAAALRAGAAPSSWSRASECERTCAAATTYFVYLLMRLWIWLIADWASLATTSWKWTTVLEVPVAITTAAITTAANTHRSARNSMNRLNARPPPLRCCWRRSAAAGRRA